MAEERAEGGDECRSAAPQRRDQQHRGRALAACRRAASPPRRALAAGAQHIGGADIAGADRAEIAARRRAASACTPNGIEPSR